MIYFSIQVMRVRVKVKIRVKIRVKVRVRVKYVIFMCVITLVFPFQAFTNVAKT